ncbi:MAG: hypothetical protein K0Q87_4883 [Neobacillus sp.]|jgi:hypothetical protein|nr:hypothetical protein [Neobacillus sp.]
MDNLEITKEIVLKLIETGQINRPINQNGATYSGETANEKYIEEVCKAYKTVFQTVNKAYRGEFTNL